jgi:hypothetical protein
MGQRTVAVWALFSVLIGCSGGEDPASGGVAGNAAAAAVPAFVRYCATDAGAASGTTLHMDGARGADTNDGSDVAPFGTIVGAMAKMRAGDTLEISGGLYTVADAFGFKPAGAGRGRETVFRAKPGERVLFTSPTKEPPNVTSVGDYVRLEGLWFGGARPARTGTACAFPDSDTNHPFFLSNGPDPVGHGKAVVGCTFFGFDGIGIGSQEDVLFQGNRHIFTGRNCYSHPIYISGGADSPDGCTKGQCSNHIIVDSSIFVANEGWSAHGYHIPFSGIVTRNVFVGDYWGSVWDGSDYLLANNFYWEEVGFSTIGPIGAMLYGGHKNAIVLNNVFGPNAPLTGTIETTDRVENNAFLGVSARGAGAVTLTVGQEQASLGLTRAGIDAAVAALVQSFGAPVDAIVLDATIDPAFASLVPDAPRGSPLVGSGVPWLDAAAVSIGPSVPGPSCQEQLWDAFHRLALRDIDRTCKLPDGGTY